MCRSCAEQPGGRRCGRPDGFSAIEGDARNRARNLNAAAAALNSGDAQAAANSLAAAAAAHNAIHGPAAPVTDPTDVATPYRDVTVAPSQVAHIRDQVGALNIQRVKVGQPPLNVDVSRQRVSDDADPGLRAWEIATVRIWGAPPEELAQLPIRTAPSQPEMRFSTTGVLTIAAAVARRSGGYVPASAGADSTPRQVQTYLQDAPGGAFRGALQVTAEDEITAAQARSWVRAQTNANEYQVALRRALSDDYLSTRDVGVVSGALSSYLAHQQREAERRQAVDSPTAVGQWWSAPGKKAQFDRMRVIGDTPVYSGSYYPKYLYTFETSTGDHVRWLSHNMAGLDVGDVVTLRVEVKAHSVIDGRRVTEVFKPDLEHGVILHEEGSQARTA